MTDQTPEARLAAARQLIEQAHERMPINSHTSAGTMEIACWMDDVLDLLADPTIAADLTLAARLRDPNDPLLDQALERATWEAPSHDTYVDLAALRAALTEGSGE